MMVKLSWTATSTKDELIPLLEECTPQEVHTHWYKSKYFENVIVKGGFSKSNIPNRLVTNALMINQQRSIRYWGRIHGMGTIDVVCS